MVKNLTCLYLHVSFNAPNKFFASPIIGSDQLVAEEQVEYSSTAPLIFIRKRIREKVLKNLLSAEESDKKEEEDLRPEEYFWPYFKPIIDINHVFDQTAYPIGGVPAQIADFYHFDRRVNAYYPPLYLSDFWTLTDKFVEINETTTDLNLTLNFQVYNQYYFMLTASVGFNDQLYKRMGME